MIPRSRRGDEDCEYVRLLNFKRPGLLATIETPICQGITRHPFPAQART